MPAHRSVQQKIKEDVLTLNSERDGRKIGEKEDARISLKPVRFLEKREFSEKGEVIS